jgi:hypothetical protein
MPRLVGKKINHSVYLLPLGFVALIVSAFFYLEYRGVIDTIPNFGQDKVRDELY